MEKVIFQLSVWALIIVTIMSCTTSSKALQKANYRSALNLAYKEYSKDQGSQVAQQNLLISADTLSHRIIASTSLDENEEIRDWKRKRNTLYDGLAMLGDYNIKTNGLISESYDQMCDAKYIVDLSIVDYYYLYGIDLLKESIETGDKSMAREAYSEFELSEREEARLFYHDLDTLYASCIEYGSIVVEIPDDVELSDKFHIEWYEDSTESADCTITISKDKINIEVQRSNHVNTLSEKVVTGTEPVLDTAGVVIRHRDIKTEVFAYENIEEVTIIASASVYVDVQKNTKDCYLESYTIAFSEEEECENITYTGDARALKLKSDERCNESLKTNRLRRQVRGDLNSTIHL